LVGGFFTFRLSSFLLPFLVTDGTPWGEGRGHEYAMGRNTHKHTDTQT